MKKSFLMAIIVFFIFSSFMVFAGIDDVAHNGVQASDNIAGQDHAGNHAEHKGEGLGAELPLWSVIPFAGILLSIALFPLLAANFWHHHFGKISFFWALLFAVPFIFVYKGVAIHEILHIYLIDYIPFIILLWALFTVSGGILLKGTIKGKPLTNTIMLIIGTFLSSWIGTTGAAMLLIRPLIRSNGHRKNKVHIMAFFIFLVANIGGALTPLGDPPLFLGFLHGVDFSWTLKLFPEMFVLSLILLVIFFLLDSFYYKKEKIIEETSQEPKDPMKILGLHNITFLLGIIAGVLFSGMVKVGHVNILGVHMAWENIIRDFFLIFMGFLSLKTTSSQIREENNFNWFPIEEVAKLFAGIFMTIIPALAILKAGSSGQLAFVVNAVKEPWHYFWITGSLSSFLDNAPTYLTFFNTAIGQLNLGSLPEAVAAKNLMTTNAIYLKTISCGAVFMGAVTYIGNAPNFMVKAIAEENGIEMPSFFAYIFKYSLIFLMPAFIVVTFIFF